MNSQNVTVQNSYITINSGEIATLKWSLKKGDVLNKITSPEVYRGDRVNRTKSLLNAVADPNKYAKELFNDRLSKGRLVGDVPGNKEVDFELNVTNVQYRDTGLFHFKVSFESADDRRVFKDVYATIALKVEGSSVLLFIVIFFSILH